MGEGQYRLSDQLREEVNTLDNACVEAVAGGSEQQFYSSFTALLEATRSGGEPIGQEEILPSDVIIPPSDITFAEATREFTGEGIIPD